VGAGVAAEQVAQRVVDGSRKASGCRGQRKPKGVAEPAGILDGGPVLDAANADPDGAPGRLELGQPVGGLRVAGGVRIGRSGVSSVSADPPVD